MVTGVLAEEVVAVTPEVVVAAVSGDFDVALNGTEVLLVVLVVKESGVDIFVVEVVGGTAVGVDIFVAEVFEVVGSIAVVVDIFNVEVVDGNAEDVETEYPESKNRNFHK